MDSVAVIQIRLREIIDAKLDRLKAIDEERESILRELDEARRMLAIPEVEDVPPLPIPAAPKPPKIKMDYNDLCDLLHREGPKTREEIGTAFGFVDGRTLQAWCLGKRLVRHGDKFGLP